MSRAYIEQFHVQGYGCIKDASVRLTPLHALIGPNDSGKSTLLRALRTALQFAGGKFDVSGQHLSPFNPHISGQNAHFSLITDREQNTSHVSCNVNAQSGKLDEYIGFGERHDWLLFLQQLKLDKHLPADVVFRHALVNTARGWHGRGLLMRSRGHMVVRSLSRLTEQGSATKRGAGFYPGDLMLLPPDIAQSYFRPNEDGHGRATYLGDETTALDAMRSCLRPAHWLRLTPDALRQPAGLIREGQPVAFLDEHGTGLPAVYDAIQSRDVEHFLELQKGLRNRFPAVKKLRLSNVTESQKSLGLELNNGTVVPVETMSEGLLYYLAFAALRHLDSTSVILLEEPENGLHPARIADVVRLLRELSKTTQVVMTTHSPLVINELEGDEVSVVTRTEEEGTKFTLLRDTHNFEKRSQAYALGELWVSYADGETESALLQGGPPS